MSIILDKVNYKYSESTAYEKHALKDIDLKSMMESLLDLSGILVRANLL